MAKEILNEFQKLFEEASGDWGSCQYDTAAQTYHAILAAFNKYGAESVLKAFGIEHYKRRSNQYILSDLEILDIDTDEPIALESIEHYFETAKDQSWDLWSAALFVDSVLDTDDRLIEVELEVFGPELNQLSQSENFQVGFGCAVLTFYNKVAEDSFIGFDT